MFHFTIRDVLWLTGAILAAIALIAVGQSEGVATLEGNFLSLAAVTVVVFAVVRTMQRHKRNRI